MMAASTRYGSAGLGKLSSVITMEDLKQSRESPTITGSHQVASYSWSKKKDKPTIWIPGRPPRLQPPPLPYRLTLPEDRGRYFKDIDAAQIPDYPMLPAIEAILDSESDIKLGKIDIVACASSLTNLVQFVRGELVRGDLVGSQGHVQKGFRIVVEVVGDTAFFIRQVHPPTATFEHPRGVTHNLGEYFTSWHKDVEGSTSHHRIMKYHFGGFQILTKSKVDGYAINKWEREWRPRVARESGHRGDLRARTDHPIGLSGSTYFAPEIASARVPSAQTQEVEMTGNEDIVPRQPTTGYLRSRGEPGDGIMTILRNPESSTRILQHSIFKLRTRSVLKIGQENAMINGMRGAFWVAQTPKLLLGFHDCGEITRVTMHDLRSDMLAWETNNQKYLRKFAWLLEELISLAKQELDDRMEIVCIAGDILEIRKVGGRFKRVMPIRVEERWTDAVLKSLGIRKFR